MQLFCNTLAKAWVSERGPPETHILSHWVKKKEKRKRKETLPYLICNNSYSCEFLGLDHHVLSLAGFVDICVPRNQKKKLDFSKEAESVLFMLRNKNTYPLQENERRRKKKSNAHRATSMSDWLSSEINERSKTDEWSLNSDGIKVKLVWTRKYCRTQEDRAYISESISSTMRSLELEEAKGRLRKRTRVKEELLLYGG